jgi:hypothetical protein
MLRALISTTVCLAAAGAYAAPPDRGGGLLFGAPVRGVALGCRLAAKQVKNGEAVWIELALRNVGEQPVALRSHVQADERHYDWFEVELTYPTPSREGCNGRYAGKRRQVVRLVAAREKSAPITVTLAPGKELVHRLDLAAWARRQGSTSAIVAGFYQLRPRYTVRGEKTVWAGRLTCPALQLVVEGKPPAGRCARNPGWQFF